MSLKPDGRSSRTRSKSRSRRDRSRSHSNVRSAQVSPGPETRTYAYASSTPRHLSPVNMPSMPGGYDEPGSSQGRIDRPPSANLPYRMVGQLPYSTGPPSGGIDMGDYKDYPPHERPGYIAAQQQSDYDSRDTDADLAYGNLPLPETRRKHSSSVSSQRSQSSAAYTSTSYRYPDSTASGQTSQYATARPQYAQPQLYEYAQPPERVSYSAAAPQNRPEHQQAPVNYAYSSQPPEKIAYSAAPQNRAEQAPSNYTYSAQPYQGPQGKQSTLSAPNAQLMDVTPGVSKQADLGINRRMNRLSVSGNRPDVTGGLAPPSPLLEAYHGTYQSISPMMAPMRLPPDSELDTLSTLSPSPSASIRGRHKRSKSSSSKIEDFAPRESKKRVRLYDAEKDALALNEAIVHHKIDVDTICDILPHLTHDQMLELRKEYKKHIKVQGRGINIAKHLKMKLSGNFGKAVYVCALGRFESESYWSNLWYQSHASRRELLIEGLMGRSNAEIRQIRDSFKDKRYGDDLVKCMEKELKPDKFRVAVLSSLEARRQEENEVYPREYIDKDVEILNRCLMAREGGESAILEIVVRRSDAHLREVLKAYEHIHRMNFAREALKKSNNLVGEVIAHILNGVINRPARDALLLRHAIDDIASHNKEEELRYELLISRLVRIHWEPAHLARVKREYVEKYRKELEHDIEDATRGDFEEFMFELCRA